ncbi:hypothetical protein N7451_010410 [Penicillium sp. IBT 35674x]|nr:hypothetical protein N7451_010410 [Penicillium sp. IBT 35674x]
MVIGVRKLLLRSSIYQKPEIIEAAARIRDFIRSIQSCTLYPEYIWLPKVEVGDIVIWDNYSTFHTAVDYPLERHAFVKYNGTKPDASGDPDIVRNKWMNEDLDLSSSAHQTWRWYDYAAFWWSYGFVPGSWYIAASLLAIGLTPGQSLGCIFLGYFLGAVGVVLHLRSAAVYHFGFLVETRIAWGLRGAYFLVIVRALTALV